MNFLFTCGGTAGRRFARPGDVTRLRPAAEPPELTNCLRCFALE